MHQENIYFNSFSFMHVYTLWQHLRHAVHVTDFNFMHTYSSRISKHNYLYQAIKETMTGRLTLSQPFFLYKNAYGQ